MKKQEIENRRDMIKKIKMKQFTNLTREQKVLFLKIENFFIAAQGITPKDFVTILGVLINKYKWKEEKIE